MVTPCSFCLVFVIFHLPIRPTSENGSEKRIPLAEFTTNSIFFIINSFESYEIHSWIRAWTFYLDLIIWNVRLRSLLIWYFLSYIRARLGFMAKVISGSTSPAPHVTAGSRTNGSNPTVEILHCFPKYSKLFACYTTLPWLVNCSYADELRWKIIDL